MIYTLGVQDLPKDVQDLVRDVGRRFQRKRTRAERTCELCGKPFVAYATARFCSPAHRLKAWRAEQRAQGKVRRN